MSNESLRQALLDNIKYAEAQVINAKSTLDEFDALPENNTFDDYQDACWIIEAKLSDMASNDCKGSHCYGADEYKQEFIVNGKHYLGKLTVQYNRHDKTYYYVDETDFTVTEL